MPSHAPCALPDGRTFSILIEAVRHLYVHVPFCDGTCRYCGFYRCPASAKHHASFAPLPAAELGLWRPRQLPAPETLYLGGGTPSVLGRHLSLLLDRLRDAVCLSRLRECTVEASPQQISPAHASAWRRRGVTRVSLGAQAFDDAVLREMGRRHGADDIVRAFVRLRQAGGFQIGLDLIAGWPGVDAIRWQRSIDAVCRLLPDHVSVYALSLDEGSALSDAVARGAVRLPDANATLDALAQAESWLTGAGYQRYEISNYALPGAQCRHHLAIWRGEDYLGLGPAAASRVGCWRWTQAPDLEAYVAAVSQGKPPPASRTRETRAADRFERFVTGLRLAEGADPDRFASPKLRAAQKQSAVWRQRLAHMAELGLTRRLGTRWRLTPRGMEVADGVMRELA